MAAVEERVDKWIWPPEVLKLAAEKGVAEFLEPLLTMTQAQFSKANQVRVLVEEDWEIPDSKAITFAVDVDRMDPDQYVKACHEWDRAFIKICPRNKVGLFGVWLNSGDS
jgi:hypothetical protein